MKFLFPKCPPNHKVFYLWQPRNGVYTVGDFMTRKEELHVVKPTTSVDEGNFVLKFHLIYLHEVNFWLTIVSATALEALVEHRITGFPVIDDNWKLVSSDLQCKQLKSL